MRRQTSRFSWRRAPLRAIAALAATLGLAVSAFSHDAVPDPSPALESGAFSNPLVGNAVSVPLALSSRPGAPYTVYLDFGGFSFSGFWGNNGLYFPGDT